ncbi:class II histone deacetylase [Corynebacterium aurimucosum]|uniref:class II histone deacetylase n=1 Tax=Corynebacterium TaxID=1716 RepID=UPI0008A36C62|nr:MULTISPECIES: class II histone deacetylase [Corynebacterium]MBZ6448638.1 class II histone deacetylase [Staphylococcus saprophyticus]MBE7365252.1 class II histone deacetylase [Corynebacterium aurimucosum]MCZ9298002.1 class II histone deacetylase [Corynebacterium hesseae]MDK6807878.1 class II histone deacetylase [Corynebacterium aurimucosum]NJJ82182.1 class II histone deacetylase [Corynebacterium aurimucosum]
MSTKKQDKVSVGYLWDTLYGWHDTGTGGNAPANPALGLQPVNRHFSSPEPKRRLNELVQASQLRKHLTNLSAKPATKEQLERIHSKEHIESMLQQSQLPKGGDCGDGGSPFGQGGADIAKLSAGGAIEMTRAVLDGEVDRGYALINPPGHHAERNRGLGFCLFNNASAAASFALEERGLERVAIVDWDVHHGNGTQDIWWEDNRVLTVSIHQDRNFPVDSGFVEERGSGKGKDFNLNIPLPPGSGDLVYETALNEIVIPALEEFKPELIILSTGYDAAMMDPLGRMMVTTSGYYNMTQALAAAADSLSEGNLVVVQEGGYCQYYVPFCGLAVFESLTGEESGFKDEYAEIVEGQIRKTFTDEQIEYLRKAYTAHFKEDSPALESLSPATSDGAV